jgi:hypothetical protein
MIPYALYIRIKDYLIHFFPIFLSFIQLVYGLEVSHVWCRAERTRSVSNIDTRRFIITLNYVTSSNYNRRRHVTDFIANSQIGRLQSLQHITVKYYQER